MPEHKVVKSDEEWRRALTPEQFHILREHGTEPPFRNAYWDQHDKGLYRCGACDSPLFASADKFDSGTGWPSFVRPVSDDAVEMREDRSHGMTRVEVRCGTCGSHLGHLFPDGPAPTGMRYCMNSGALKFERTSPPERG